MVPRVSSPASEQPRRFAYVAHCLLNANAKVDEGARCAGVLSPLVDRLRSRGYVIRQLPCPELAYGGVNRFWAVREQYDTPGYRAHCARLARPVAAMMELDLAEGGEAILIGIDGSPSLGVRLTSTGPDWGGRPDKWRDEDYGIVAGRGVFVEVLLEELARRGIKGLRRLGLGQDLLDYDEAAELTRLEQFLAEV